MIAPRIKLVLEDHSRTYCPGDMLAGHFSLEGVSEADVQALELSVLWHTEGKGDEDMSVHFFQRVAAESDNGVDFRQPRRFSTALPNSPLTYRGEILRICWSVRVRVFMARGKELTLEVPFQLGTVPQPQQVLP